MKNIKVLILLIITSILFFLIYLRFESLETSASAQTKLSKVIETKNENNKKKTLSLTPLKDLRFKTVTGKTIEMRSINKKGYIFNFWATWCLPCQIEIPHLVEMYNKYESEGILVIGISADHNTSIVTQYLKRNPLPFPVAMYQKHIGQSFGSITSIPLTYFFDRDFNLIYLSRGYTSKETIEKYIQQLLYGSNTK